MLSFCAVWCASSPPLLLSAVSEAEKFKNDSSAPNDSMSVENADNIAPLGTAYGWSKMTSSVANTGRVALPGLNDNDLTTDIDIQPNGDKIGAWEAAGVIWPNAVSINAVDFINGTVTRDGDGFLTANCTLQFSTNGTTWTNSGWTIKPAYPNSASASGKTYKFSGPTVNGIRGARVVGQVRTKDTSYHWIVKEVRVTGNTGTLPSYTITASAGPNGSINPPSAVVTQGANQSFSIVPSSGYTVADVKVDGVSVGAVSSYTFSNVQANHSISATFKVGTACTSKPATPTGLSSPSQTSSSVNLSWNAVSTPSGCTVTYNVYNGGSLVATVSSNNAVIHNLSANTLYSFTVAATNSVGTSAQSPALSVKTLPSGNYTPQQILSAVLSHMTSSVQVNTLPHINTMTRAMNVNVYQVSPGVYAYTSGMAIDTDGSDPDPDPDHQGSTTWQDSNGAQLGAHHVPFYVLGDDCWDRTRGSSIAQCPHFFYAEHNITGLQFALIFYQGNVIGAVFGDTQGTDTTPTSDNDSRELGEASVEAASLLGIPSSGTTGGVDNGVTVVIFSGPEWVVQGTNKGTGPVGSSTGSLNGNAQALVQKALNTLGASFGL
ncbi:glycoside hydrolase family 75 protein [Legionella sp. D16C41]|uniref:glycoside hydrolase family 75 protein n=1 Tax=Legionella sp. D16C41 TaxID=3402688 RepID=UPI003AF4EBFB